MGTTAETHKMGQGGCGDECCKMKSPLFGSEFVGASFLFVVSLIFWACCLSGLGSIPKCRYGEPECYFAVSLTDHQGNTASVFKNMAVEGDSDHSNEQLAI